MKECWKHSTKASNGLVQLVTTRLRQTATPCQLENTVKPLYTDIRFNDKIRYNDNLNGTIP